jgi:HD-GYP domain-containing protein (c-di-GMP phosphodiesterase class II)
MATVTIVEGSVPDLVAAALREAGHEIRPVTALDAAGVDEAVEVIVLPDEGLTHDSVVALRDANPGIRVLASRADLETPSGRPDLLLPADADPAIWALALATLDLSQGLPDPGLEEARAGLQSVVAAGQRAFDAIRAASDHDAPNARADGAELRLERSFQLLLRVMLDRLEGRIEGFAGQSGRVASLGRHLAEELGAPEEIIRAVETAGRFHDLGMHLVVSPATLRRAGPLREAEQKAIRRHPTASADAVQPLHLPDEAVSGIRDHHERLDGTGYPTRKRGDEVHLAARIVAVADSFEALTHPRPHRPAFSSADALAIIDAEGREGRLDAGVCGVLAHALERRAS